MPSFTKKIKRDALGWNSYPFAAHGKFYQTQITQASTPMVGMTYGTEMHSIPGPKGKV